MAAFESPAGFTGEDCTGAGRNRFLGHIAVTSGARWPDCRTRRSAHDGEYGGNPPELPVMRRIAVNPGEHRDVNGVIAGPASRVWSSPPEDHLAL